MRAIDREPEVEIVSEALTAARAAQAPVDGASGIGDPYWPLDGNGGIDVISYTIDNEWLFADQKVRGSTLVQLTALEELASFSLDFVLPVTKVTVDGAPAAFTRVGSHELRIRPRTPLAAGTGHRVEVAYKGRPKKIAYAGERPWLGNAREVVAMGEPHMAPWWFPANDHPTDKALMDISVTVPRGKEAIANGRLVGRKKVGKRTRWHWRADEPMDPADMSGPAPMPVARGRGLRRAS